MVHQLEQTVFPGANHKVGFFIPGKQVRHTRLTVDQNGKGGCVCVEDGCRESQLSSYNTIFSCLRSGEDILVHIKFVNANTNANA